MKDRTNAADRKLLKHSGTPSPEEVRALYLTNCVARAYARVRKYLKGPEPEIDRQAARELLGPMTGLYELVTGIDLRDDLTARVSRSGPPCVGKEQAITGSVKPRSQQQHPG